MTFLSALILGLVASAHCAGMCGGLQLVLQNGLVEQSLVVRSKTQQIRYLALLNIGRVITYVIAGLILSLIGLSAIEKLNISGLTSAARLFAGIVIVLIGVQMLMRKQRPFHFIEILGAKIWAQVSKLINHSSNTDATALINGLAWGFLPCGLVYSVLLSTIFIQQPHHSALVMLGFGLGTLPALILTGAAYSAFKSTINSNAVQKFAAVFFIVGGLSVITAPYWIDKSFIHNYPILLNSVFCVS